MSYSLSEGPMKDVARIMRSNFAAIGVDLSDMGMEAGAWRDSAFLNWDYDITMGTFASGPDPAIGAETFYLCDRIERVFGKNASGYCNPEVDTLFKAAAREIDEPKRVGMYHQDIGPDRRGRSALVAVGPLLPDRLQRQGRWASRTT